MKMKLTISMLAVVALVALPVLAGEWHTGTTNLCTDCHTMHFSQSHNWDSGTAPTTTPAPNGNWLSATGPNEFLLKAPANQLCLACHDGQTFAPDVLATNTNASPTQGRMAGALNDPSFGAPYDEWKGHTLGSTAVPPGYDPTVVGGSDWYNEANGLECISCHAQHGPAGAYRNLGPYSMTGITSYTRPSYVINTTNDTTKDVWLNMAGPYTPNTGDPAAFNPLFDYANVSYNRIDATVGTTKTSNKMDTFCAACHGNFHGGPGDTAIGATVAALDAFIRHPTAQTAIGAAAAQGYGGHSALSRYTGATTKVKVYASDRTGYTDATPGCVSCHKAHGNQNPFGLVYLNRTSTSVDEQGGWGSGQTQNNMQGYRNLCGQCHGQAN